jgi:Putative membrane protein insertion efficiency factor
MSLSGILIRAYHSYITVLTPALCNFEYTCSKYAKASIAKFGFVDGTILALRYMKQCAKEGKSLRLIQVKKKHYFQGFRPPQVLPEISRQEYFDFYFRLLLYTCCALLVPMSILNYDLGFSLLLAVIYAVLLAMGVYFKYNNKKFKSIKYILMLVLIPPVAVSFPSMVIASALNATLEPTSLVEQAGVDYSGYKIASSFILGACGAGLLFYIPILGAVIMLAGYLTSFEVACLPTGRINNLAGLICLIGGSIGFYFSPILALPALLLWWESNKRLVK